MTDPTPRAGGRGRPTKAATKEKHARELERAIQGWRDAETQVEGLTSLLTEREADYQAEVARLKLALADVVPELEGYLAEITALRQEIHAIRQQSHVAL